MQKIRVNWHLKLLKLALQGRPLHLKEVPPRRKIHYNLIPNSEKTVLLALKALTVNADLHLESERKGVRHQQGLKLQIGMLAGNLHGLQLLRGRQAT